MLSTRRFWLSMQVLFVNTIATTLYRSRSKISTISHCYTKSCGTIVWGMEKEVPCFVYWNENSFGFNFKTIVATAVLHNIAIERNDNLPAQNNGNFQINLSPEIPVETVRQQGNAARTMLIDRYVSVEGIGMHRLRPKN